MPTALAGSLPSLAMDRGDVVWALTTAEWYVVFLVVARAPVAGIGALDGQRPAR
jgi:hypothetical protein